MTDHTHYWHNGGPCTLCGMPKPAPCIDCHERLAGQDDTRCSDCAAARRADMDLPPFDIPARSPLEETR